MGQYLSIGICTNFSISKEKFLIAEVEQSLASAEYDLSLYERVESEKYWRWELKEELFSPPLANFVEKQLSFYGADTDEAAEGLMQDLRNCKTKADFIGLAKEGGYEHFQWDRYGESDSIRMPFRNYLRINYDCIMLFAEGKIMMEGSGGLFSFFAKNIALANPEFEIAKAIKVYITG